MATNPFADLIPGGGAQTAVPGYIPGRPKQPTALELDREARAARAEDRANEANRRANDAADRAAAAADRQAKIDEKRLTTEGRLTESEGKTTAFYNRALGADRDFEASGVANEPRGVVAQGLADTLPAGIVNTFTSAQRQKAEQAKRDFIAASLRYESGAAISPTEFDKQDITFFPQPGDSPEVMAQKRAARQRVIESFKVSSGAGADKVDALRGPQSAVQDPREMIGVNEELHRKFDAAVGVKPEDLSPPPDFDDDQKAVFSKLSPQQRADYLSGS
jgi:hypothetical protein